MKTSWKSLVCLVGLFVGGFCLSAWTRKDAFRIPNGREGWPVVFEDTELGFCEKQAMFEDYRALCLLLEPCGSYDSKTLEGEPIRWMQYGAENWHVPDSVSGHIGLLRVEKDGSEVAVVDRALSDAYRRALANREKHRKAYDCLPDFVDTMNHLLEQDLPATLDEMLYFSKDSRRFSGEIEDGTIKHFVEAYGNYRYELTSMLDWGEFEGLPMAPLLKFSNSQGGNLHYFLAVFVNGRWKMLVHRHMFA